MSFPDQLEAALRKELGPKVKFWRGWKTRKPIGDWRGPGRKPVALVLHHTGGAATASTRPDHAGNKTGANNGQVRFVSNHPTYGMPCSQFCLDRDGTVYVFTPYPVYHAGTGSFAGKVPWSRLAVPKDSGNTFMLGVEIVSKGATDDLTEAQWKSLAALARACATAAGWDSVGTLHLPRHKDYAGPRKVDLRASNVRIRAKLAEYGRTHG